MSRAYNYWIAQQEEPLLQLDNTGRQYTPEPYFDRGFTAEEWRAYCERNRQETEEESAAAQEVFLQKHRI